MNLNESSAAEQVIQDGSQVPNPPAAAPQDEGTTNRLRQLIARERELYDSRNALKQQEQTWQQRESDWQRWQRIQELAKKDPEAAVRELGVDPEAINEQRLKSPEQRMFDDLKAELAAVRGELNKYRSDEEQTRQQQTLQRARAEIDSILQGEGFELTRQYEDHDLIFQTAALYQQKTGKFVSPEEAARWVEAEREQQLEKILATKKAQGIWAKIQKPADQAGQQAAREAIADAKQQTSQGQSPRQSESPTLTSDLTGGTEPKEAATSVAQLRARALAAMKAAWPST